MTTETSTNNPEVSTKPNFGEGRYSALMQEVFDDAQAVFGCAPATAEKLARQVASDLGAIFRNAPVDVKLSKLNKDGKLTIAEASKVKGVTITDSITCLRAIQYANEAGSHGFSRNFTEWSLNERLTAALSSFKD